MGTSPRPPDWRKRITSVLIAALLVTALCLWLSTDAGSKIRHDPRLLYKDFQPFLSRHLILAPLAYIGIYIVLAVLALPVWWIQILAGLGFGLIEGTFISLIGTTIGSTLTVALSRWIAADWFHEKVEPRVQQLKKLDETLGHNGFLVVMTIRLVHLLPLGLCNYALGVTLVSYIDVILGSFLGGIPSVAIYVGVGAHYNPLRNWRFDTVVATINIVLLLPLIMRYLRPDWFKRIGVE